MTEDLSKNILSRLNAKRQWTANPCGSVGAPTYDKGYFQKVEINRYFQQYWQKSFFRFAEVKGKVLEIGVGLGTDLKQFARAGCDCHGIDITQKHLSLTRRNFMLEGIPVTLSLCDAEKICYPDKTFDCIYSFGVIHHIPNVESVLEEVYRILKPGGILWVSVYHKYSIHTFSLLMRSIINGNLWRLGLSGVLSTIELGADGRDIKPYVKLYSLPMLKSLIQGNKFQIERMGVRQVNFEPSSPLGFLRKFESIFGWYVCCIARKPSEPAVNG